MNRMHLPRIAGLLFCATFLLGASQCHQQKQEDQTNGSPVFVTTMSLQDTNGDTQTSFTAGQPVVLKLTVYNRSDAEQTLWFNSGEHYNFAIMNAGTGGIVWYWSANAGFEGVITKLVFQPHETQSFTAKWNQTDDSDLKLPLGQYEVFGGLTVTNLGKKISFPVDADTMAPYLPEPTQMSPTQYRSTLSMFTIE